MVARGAGTAPGGRLVMTLLARDEIDIIEKNVRHHLAQGVDFIIATDNGSVDGTREVLAAFRDEGRLHLIDEPAYDLSQAVWVNRMGRLAYEEFGASAIFHCDADEFWYALSGHLGTEISASRERAFKVDSFPVLLSDRGGQETADDAVWVVLKQARRQSEIDVRAENIFLRPSFGKVMTSTRDGYLEVKTGNHTLRSGERLRWSKDVYLLHYPTRSKEQFWLKVIQGGAAVTGNPALKPTQSVHRRQWYAHYLEGTLEEDYRKLLVADPTELLEAGVICNRSELSDEAFRRVMAGELKRRSAPPPLFTRATKYGRSKIAAWVRP
jgi:hypothetical protein